MDYNQKYFRKLINLADQIIKVRAEEIMFSMLQTTTIWEWIVLIIGKQS